MHISENRPDCGPESSAGFWVNRVSKLTVRQTDARLRPLGLAVSHLPVLRALAQRGALSQTELARIAGVEQPSMAETIRRMERDGLIQREPDPKDKRVALIALKTRSRARFSKAMAVLRECEQEAMSGLSYQEQDLLRDLLKRVARNLEQPSPASANKAIPR